MQKVLIIGDGIVANCTAIMLINNGFKPVLATFNSASHEKKHEKKIDRFFSINLLSKIFFQKYDIWQGIADDAVVPYNKIITWDSLQDEEVNFESREISHKFLGYIISESALTKSIAAILDESNIKKKNFNENQSLLNEYVLSDLENTGTNNYDYVIRTKNNDLFEKEFSKSSVTDYKQKAFVMNVCTKTKTNHIAFQKFSNGQIFGLLPIEENKYNLIWSMNSDLHKKINTLDTSKIIDTLNREISDQIGIVDKISEPITFPLFGYMTKLVSKNRVINIGSALHSVHPLAGLGLNMGIQDLFILDKIIEKNNQFINQSSLKKFSSQITGINKKIYHTINFLKYFYSDLTFSKTLRKISLIAFNRNSMLKKSIIRNATGLDTFEIFNK